MLLRSWYNKLFSPHKAFVNKLSPILGFVPQDISVYLRAFRHKSLFRKNNERLEFLGDSILDAVVSHEIYLKFKNKNEGDLSKLRSKAVSRVRLNAIGKSLNLIDLLEFKIPASISKPSSLHGNTLEALVGAVYLDKGYKVAYNFTLKKLIKPHINWNQLDKEIFDFKSLLFHHAQKHSQTLTFEVDNEDAKGNNKKFEVSVHLNGENLAQGSGKNKKSAEQVASKAALIKLKILGNGRNS